VEAGQKRPKKSAQPATDLHPPVGAASTRTPDATESLQHLVSLSVGLGAGASTEVRLPRLRAALRWLFHALPKNSDGRLARSTVRYALHRHFVHHHGMYLKGLDPEGDVGNTSFPAKVLEDRVPSHVVHKFEERLDGGFDLEELSLMAATLEHLVQLDAVERLRVLYRLTNRSTEEDISSDDVTMLMERFLVLQITGSDATMTSQQLEHQWRNILPDLPSWPQLQAWLRTVQDSILNAEKNGESDVHGGGINFEAVQKVLEAVVERFGGQQDSDCQDMRGRLQALETGEPGRVQLSNFYQSKSGQFIEKKEYLMALGAIEEKRGSAGELDGTYVIIPNYLQSVTNCLPSTSMYMVCCLNKCEEVLRYLEIQIGSPTATPEEIVKILESFPSATVEAPRNLPDSLLQRLRGIALTHEAGHVPLHGRLFSQWLHLAYPHECPMPAKIGTARPITAEDWLLETNTSSMHTEQEISELLLRAEHKDQTDGEQSKQGGGPGVPVENVVTKQAVASVRWDLNEDMVFPEANPSAPKKFRSFLRALAMIGASIGLVVVLAQHLTSATGTGKGPSQKSKPPARDKTE